MRTWRNLTFRFMLKIPRIRSAPPSPPVQALVIAPLAMASGWAYGGGLRAVGIGACVAVAMFLFARFRLARAQRSKP